MRLLIALAIVIQLCGPASAQTVLAKSRTTQKVINAEEVFAQLVRMVGVWRPADNPDSSLRIHFYLTAGDTVLVESWEVRGEPHSLTLYHRDGKALLATHYCPQGNQPRLKLVGHGTGGLHFTLHDVTDLDPTSETHQHDLWFDLSEPGYPIRSETYASKEGVGAVERLRLVSAGKK
ncbi:hypothetical protein [Sphingomonas sp. M1-B02]|uniref:hypothetical protein n=1 Tax=Sphingomonas sp. M1-B02 TaxID=3114300 RepID=UPI0022400E2E|nr:hypothetical protein [Sphingomonas sp. S6-11]UZK67773.1 hypothetical protein OKW87_08080 [Sphingomonas sp. S6-11]